MKPQEVITTLLDKLAVPFSAVEESLVLDQTVYRIETDNPKALIGTRGETLRALTHIVKKMIEQEGGDTQFGVDVNDYRSRKIDELKKTATLLAERARTLQYDVEMAPMSAYERMVVHTILSEEPNIKTESRGEGRDRRLVIQYVG